MDKITIGGKSVPDVAKMSGISQSTLYSRLRQNLPVEDVLSNLDRRESRSVTLTIDDQTGTISQWAAASGTSYHTIYRRYRAGYPHKQCVYGRQETPRTC